MDPFIAVLDSGCWIIIRNPMYVRRRSPHTGELVEKLYFDGVWDGRGWAKSKAEAMRFEIEAEAVECVTQIAASARA